MKIVAATRPTPHANDFHHLDSAPRRVNLGYLQQLEADIDREDDEQKYAVNYARSATCAGIPAVV